MLGDAHADVAGALFGGAEHDADDRSGWARISLLFEDTSVAES